MCRWFDSGPSHKILVDKRGFCLFPQITHLVQIGTVFAYHMRIRQAGFNYFSQVFVIAWQKLSSKKEKITPYHIYTGYRSTELAPTRGTL